MKPKAKQLLWTMFSLQIAFSLGILVLSIQVHVAVTRFMDKQPAMQASGARARTHIQTERDIEQLRATALHIQSVSDITWGTVIDVMRDLDMGVWAFFLSSVGLAIVGGCTVYAFRVQKMQPSSVRKPIATAP